MVPVVPVALALGLGIWIADLLGFTYSSYWLISGMSLAAGLLFMLVWRRPQRWWSTLSSLVALCLVFAFGGWRHQQSYAPGHPSFFAHQQEEGDLILGEIEAIRTGGTNLRLEIKVEWLLGDSAADRPACGKLLLYVPPDEQAANLATGDHLLFNGKPSEIRPPLNPGVFDLRAYWQRKGIYHQVFLRESTAWKLSGGRSGGIYARAEGWRRAWFKTFQRHLKGDRLAVAAALVLGKRDLISEEVKSAYTDTGAVHVLAVSGLHVGIIYLILRFLLITLLKLDRRPKGRILVALLSVICVWLFALVSGLSPSVQRAALMFSILALGGLSFFKSHVFNTLAAAAIIMLTWNPGQLFQVGFQLSFTAIIGIVAFTNHLDRLIYWPYKLLRVAWSAMAASTGAQLGTLPLSLYYFGQFPAYFLLSGTVVIVFAFATMFAGLAHGLVAGILGWDSLASLTGGLLNLVVGVQNALIFSFSKLPGALIKVSFIDLPLAWLLALSICCLAVYVRWRQKRLLWLLAGSFIVMLLWAGAQVQSKDQAAVLTVFHRSRGSLIDVVDASGNAWSFGEQPAAKDLAWTAGPFRETHGYSPTSTFPLTGQDTLISQDVRQTNQLLQVGTSRWQILDGKQKSKGLVFHPEATHLLVVNGYRPQDVPVFPDTVPVPQIIVDGSNPYYRLAAWKAWAEERDLTLHLTAELGAFQHHW